MKEKENRLMWCALLVFLVITLIQSVLGMLGLVIPDIVGWLYNLSLLVFMLAVVLRVIKKQH